MTRKPHGSYYFFMALTPDKELYVNCKPDLYGINDKYRFKGKNYYHSALECHQRIKFLNNR